ncbi:MAG: FN3 associated domain-containing protein, partial [Bacteroidota bacterium]
SEELELLKSWIQHGADIAIASTDLAEEDSLKVAIGKYTDAIQAASETVYDFDFASQELIATLNTPYRSVKQKSSTSPALEVIIMGRQTFDFADFQALAQVKEQIVALDMSYAPVGDEVFAVIAQLPNLESLHLNFTNISGDKLSLLNECQRLKTLSLAGTAVSKSQILSLEIPTLEELYLWNTRIADAELAALRTTLSSVNIQSGIERTEEEQLTLTPPVLKSANNVLFTGDEIVLGHKFNGVEIRYTIDGSQPDSTANLYQAPLSFTEEVTIKTIALKSGWKDSEVATFTFRERGHIPQQIEMLQVARMLWRGKGGKGLTDGEQGKVEEIPYFSWIGFQDKPFVALADMGEQLVTLDSIGISYGVQLYDWLRASPPTRVEIYGGDSKDDLNLLVDQSVGFSRKEGDDTAVISYFSVDRSSFRYYKIVAHTIEVLPTWHRHKGNKGRLFVDQLFFVQNNNRQLSFSDQ